MRLALTTLALIAGLAAYTSADVQFVEEIINPGIGAKKTGARKTTKKVFIKDKKQTVESHIETDKETAKALVKQGQPLASSVILYLDSSKVYEIDLDKYTALLQKMPPAPKAAAKAATPPNPDARFQIKEDTTDTLRVAGIPCHKVVAKMAVGYRDPKTQLPVKQNRYTYTACIARTFPGYSEIKTFQDLQKTQTSYPSLIGGGLEQLADRIEDFDELEKQLKALEGFALQSSLVAEVKYPDREAIEVFRLDRQVKTYQHSAIPDSVFKVSSRLTLLKPE